MIDCPKCKFRQPKDQYCANCGIDMIAYESIAEKKSESFFSSGIFQVFLLLCFAAGVAYFISQSDRPQNWVRKFSHSSKTMSNPAIGSQPVLSEEKTPLDSDPEIEVVPSPAANINAFAAAPASGEPLTAEAELVWSEVKLTFAEVSRSDLAAWVNESQKLELYQSFIDFSAGILPQFKTKFQSTFKELKTEQKKLFLKKPQALLFGKTIDDTSEFIGFQTNLDLKSNENQSTKGHINITKITRYGKTELPIEFDLQKDAVFFINWKTAMVGFENETLLFSTTPFQVLKSQDFLNQKTEFIILIEPL